LIASLVFWLAGVFYDIKIDCCIDIEREKVIGKIE
jgi:hypothetical protein